MKKLVGIATTLLPASLSLCLAGERLEVEVVTELSADGSFWCQLLLSNEGSPSYDRLQEDLQAAGGGRGEGEAFTPVFYHERELCTALFSEDGHWYRARIERVCPGAVRIGTTCNKEVHPTSSLSTASHDVHCQIH